MQLRLVLEHMRQGPVLAREVRFEMREGQHRILLDRGVCLTIGFVLRHDSPNCIKIVLCEYTHRSAMKPKQAKSPTVALVQPASAAPQSPRKGRAKSVETRKLTQCEIVRSALEKDIFSGNLPPDSPLDEDAIAQRFAVSRTPVREALLQLIEAGLVEKPSRQRAVVAPLDLRRLIQMFETLSELEATCARIAARRITEHEKEALAAIQRLSDAALAAGDDDEYGRQGIRFHVAVWRAAHNDVLFDITRNLAVRLNPYRMFQLRSKGRPEANNEDHKLILELLSTGQAEEVYALMRGHVTVQGDVLAEYISSPPRPVVHVDYA
jgi:DNA-binding GntR family transcriptional regulator